MRLLARNWWRQEENIRKVLRKLYELDWTGSCQGQISDFCDDRDGSMGSVTGKLMFK